MTWLACHIVQETCEHNVHFRGTTTLTEIPGFGNCPTCTVFSLWIVQRGLSFTSLWLNVEISLATLCWQVSERLAWLYWVNCKNNFGSPTLCASMDCLVGEDGINDPMEYSFRVKLFTDDCLRRLSNRLSTFAVTVDVWKEEEQEAGELSFLGLVSSLFIQLVVSRATGRPSSCSFEGQYAPRGPDTGTND